MSAGVTVVVPVFNAPDQLAACLRALRATVAFGYRVILIDDASDDPRTREVLARAAGGWTVLTNPRNRGFVATANRGIEAADPDDVVLLNSDTQPAGRWLARLAACLAADGRIASATPFTNNGEIASLPEFCRANPVPEDPGAWARACIEAGPPVYPDIPTAVGFCMAMRREVIDRIGAFDAGAFGRGYGEENDWSLRARAAGYRNVLCDDAFVAHEGGASFGPLGLGPGGRAMETLIGRHPDYPELVGRFIEQDPLAPIRARVLARIDSAGTGAD